MVTNQVPIDWEKFENTSEDRYFHYEGYDKFKGFMPERIVMKK